MSEHVLHPSVTRRTLLGAAGALLPAALLGRAPAAADPPASEPGFRFGAVYFRKFNPPREDWERDHQVAAEDGHTLFRHWVPWNVVEVAPGRYDWADYDRMLDLGAKYGIRVVLAEMLIDYPEWLVSRHPEARVRTADGRVRPSEMHVSSTNGGHYALCLNNAPVRDAAAAFLSAMAARYKGHPALLGYDLWNECTFYAADRLCYCGGCQAEFRAWAGRRYGTTRAVADRWHRPSLTDWEHIELPTAPGLFPDFLDGVQFRNDDAVGWLAWRREVIRKVDAGCQIVAHGNARTHADTAVCAGDDFRPAGSVDVFGYTHYFGQGNTPLLSVDLIRGASRGKPFWRAEAVGGPQWSRRKIGQPRPAMDALDDPANIRFDCLVSMAGGATAYQNPRWRPLLDGPLFGAYGWYAMDGGRTAKSKEVSELAAWASGSASAAVWKARPVRGDVACVLVDESQAWCYAMQGDTDAYANSVRGTHRALTDAGLQCDFVKPTGLDGYRTAYVPFPVALSDATLEALLAWMSAGGRLVLEGCAGYFNDAAHAYPTQPSRGIAEAAGCAELAVSFALDRNDGLQIKTSDGMVPAALYRQSYRERGGTVLGRFEDGTAAVVQRTTDRGSVTLIGTMPGYAYHHRPTAEARAWLKELLGGGGDQPWTSHDRPGCVARVWSGSSGAVVWVLNPDPAATEVTIRLSPKVTFGSAPRAIRGRLLSYEKNTRTVRLEVAGRDAAVIA